MQFWHGKMFCKKASGMENAEFELFVEIIARKNIYF